MKKPILVSVCLLGCGLIIGLAALMDPKDPACVRIQAKADLAEDFCEALAEKAANDKCAALAEDPVTMGQCMRVVVPMAHSSCMSYLNMDKLHEQAKDLCK